MSQTTTVPPLVNQAIKFVLRSPMHGLVSQTVLLITFTGRKSGKTYTTPVSYSHSGEQLTVFTHAVWWQNLLNNALVSLRIRGADFQGWAEPVDMDKQVVETALAAHLRAVPSDARWYGVAFDSQGKPRAEEVKKAAQTVVMIRIRLC